MPNRRAWLIVHGIGAGTRLHLNPFDASYIIGLNASTLLSGALLSSFMVTIDTFDRGRRLVRELARE